MFQFAQMVHMVTDVSTPVLNIAWTQCVTDSVRQVPVWAGVQRVILVSTVVKVFSKGVHVKMHVIYCLCIIINL